MKLIINADDFGLRQGIDLAVIELFEKNIVSSVSVMVNAENSEFALNYIKKEPTLGAGLHLDLDAFLYNEGFGTNQAGCFLVPDIFFDDVKTATIESEIVNQIDSFFRLSGRLPDHIDGHHNFHMFLPVLHLLVKIMNKYEIHAIRFDHEFYKVSSERVEAIDLLEHHGILFPDCFIRGPVLSTSSHDFIVAEMMVHVSMSLPEEENWRINERATLLSDSCYQKLNSANYELTNFSNLLQNSAIQKVC